MHSHSEVHTTPIWQMGSRHASIADFLAPHVPALDGVRGLAVLLVLYCHSTALLDVQGILGRAYLASARISWAGVDLFFVLSGFLITGVLLKARGGPAYFRNFYARRTLRIFPLYYAFLVLALVVFPLWPAVNAHFGRMPESQWPYWLYLSNYYQTFHSTKHIVFVSWSLAIEEQFYLLWPLVVFAVKPSTLARICIGMFAGSLLLRVGLFTVAADWLIAQGLEPWRVANNFTPCRLDGLAAGALVALLARGVVQLPGRQRDANLAPWWIRRAGMIGWSAGLAMLALVVGSYLSGWRGGIGQSAAYATVGYSVLAILFASLLIRAVAAKPTSVLKVCVTSRLLTVFGKYSYAVYMLHYPVNLLVRELLIDPNQGTSQAAKLALQAVYYLVCTAATLACAWVSWHVFEKHFLKFKDVFAQPPGQGASPPHHEMLRPILTDPTPPAARAA